ncbi:MAG: hypothetical protein MJ188_03610 [Treponema sp.]|nr:hypothetical protein [Treponema sp.]
MKLNQIILQSKLLSHNGIARQNLKNGNQVLVRIIAHKGGEKYEASVAGARIQLTAKHPMKIGSSFIANISAKNGIIQLVPQDNQNVNQNIKMPFSFENTANNLALLQSLGLPEDDLSMQILQQFKQQEIKFDPEIMQNLRKKALKFGDKKKTAAEVLMLLLSKKMNASEEEILQLLKELNGDFEDRDKEKAFELMNKINEREGEWFFIPFEIVNLEVEKNGIDDLGDVKNTLPEEKKDSLLGQGIIRLLFDKAERLKMMNIHCRYEKGEYLFNLNFTKGQLESIRLNESSILEIAEQNIREQKIEEIIENLNKRFIAIGKNIQIEWCERSEIEGPACQNEKIFFVDGDV